MNNEIQFAQKISHALNQRMDDLSPALAARLHAARTQALSHQRQPATMLSLAGVGHVATDFLRTGALTTVLILTLVVGVAGSIYWNEYVQADENEEIDSALLADELPINAYLDDGFQLWVDHSSQPLSY